MRNENTVARLSSFSSPKRAMVLAAGLGTRMRPITDKIPKPLVKVYGKTLLDHGLDALARSNVESAVVNMHHHAEQIEDHLKSRTNLKIELSDERDELLDSGGGVVKALPHLGNEPFFLLNADSFWVEGFKPNLSRMAEIWNENDMDVLLLLSGMGNAIGFGGAKGDFNMDADGRLERREENKIAPFAYAGAAIMKPCVFDNAPTGKFSLNKIFDEAIENGRLFGVRLEGLWLHVGTPDAIVEAEEAIARSAA